MPNNSKPTAQEILKKPYARILVPEEDGTYSAEILEFPGCYAEGDTAAEAIDDLEKAAASWIEATLGQNKEIPEPLANYEYSGKINLRLPKSIHKQAARFAQKEDVSLNQFFASAIASRIGAEEICNRLLERIEGRMIAAACSIQIHCVATGFLLGDTVQSGQLSEFPFVQVNNPSSVATVGQLPPLKAITNG